MAKAKKTESSETPEKKTPAKAAPKATKAAAPKATKKATAAPADKPVPTAAAAKKPAAAAKQAPAKAASSKAAGKKSAPTPATPSSPLIDTDLAAQTAAAMLLNRPATPAPAAGAPQPNKESSAFKNLKDQLAKPKPAALSNLFGPTGGSQKHGGHFNLHQQKGHNQTFGGLNKAGVPRRTNG